MTKGLSFPWWTRTSLFFPRFMFQVPFSLSSFRLEHTSTPPEERIPFLPSRKRPFWPFFSGSAAPSFPAFCVLHGVMPLVLPFHKCPLIERQPSSCKWLLNIAFPPPPFPAILWLLLLLPFPTHMCELFSCSLIIKEILSDSLFWVSYPQTLRTPPFILASSLFLLFLHVIGFSP